MSGTRARAERRRTVRTTVVTTLTRTVPGLSEEDISVLLETAGITKGKSLGQLADHLAEHPNALTSGDPQCPLSLIRLTHALHEAGHSAVVRPGCADCGKVTVDLARNGPGGRLCQMCWVRANHGTCARCGATSTRIAARRAEGGICYPCYRTDADVVEECGRCRRVRMPVARLSDGTPLCLGCWTPPTHRCRICGEQRPAAVSGPDGALCVECYRLHGRPERLCGRCGRVRPISRRATGDSPDLCYGCDLGPDQVCSACQRVRPCKRGPEGSWFCHSCKPRTNDTCSHCRRMRPVHARWPLGPLCGTCHAKLLDAPTECARCEEIHVLIARSEDGASICGPCAGAALDPRCTTCGRPGRHYSPDKCAHCVLEDRLRDLLTGPDGTVSQQLQPVHQALTAARNPRSLIHWLTKSPNAKLLAHLAATGEPISHEVLDELPPGRHEYYVRQLLVTTGVLPERHDDLERLPAWLDKTLSTKPAEHSRLIRPFTHWFLLRRARRRAAARRQPAIANNYLRTRITTALKLLAWLDEHNLVLADLDQPTLDEWLVNGNASSYTIRYFLDWACDRGIAPKLAVPVLPRQDPERILDEQERWDLLRRCLTDETMPLDTRAAAALLLLFGLPVSRIRHLTADQLDIGETRSLLHTGQHPLLLPPKLANLLKQLADAPHTRARLVRDGTAPRWLFPGLTPGQPTSQPGFRVKLRALGLDARPARNAALISLAGNLPTPVLADVLGLSTTIAERWAALAQRDWATYIATQQEKG